MITFVVQNETHALNFAPIIKKLQLSGISEKYLQTVHLDKIYGLSTYDLISVPNQKMVELDIPSPYYHLNQFKRLQWLLQVKESLLAYVRNTKVLIIGSDGGIQRLMANAVRINGGKIILLVDGLLHPWPDKTKARYIAKRNINRFFVKFNLNYLVPADVGHSNLDYIYVMHSTVKNILLEQGVKSPISVITLPRYDLYLQEYQKFADNRQSNQCLYVAGSFKWHGLYQEARQQQQDLVDMLDFADRHKDWKIRIRVHPREPLDDYVAMNLPSNVKLSMGATPVQQDLGWASIMVTARSTVAFEAELIGLPVLIYTKNFVPPSEKSFFKQNPYFSISDNIDDIVKLQSISHKPKTPRSSVPLIALQIKQFFGN